MNKQIQIPNDYGMIHIFSHESWLMIIIQKIIQSGRNVLLSSAKVKGSDIREWTVLSENRLLSPLWTVQFGLDSF